MRRPVPAAVVCAIYSADTWSGSVGWKFPLLKLIARLFAHRETNRSRVDEARRFLPCTGKVGIACGFASARALDFLVPPSDATQGQMPLSLRAELVLPRLGDWKMPAFCWIGGVCQGGTHRSRSPLRA
jgi:hypothetical protein